MGVNYFQDGFTWGLIIGSTIAMFVLTIWSPG